MTATRLGLLSYLFGMLFDIAAVRNVPRVKPFMLAAMAASQLWAIYRLAARSPRLPVPRAVRAVCAVLSPLALLAMFYSIFVEIPLRKAWIEEGHMDELVTDGTYALSRHPGVLFYTVWILAAALATRSRRLLTAAPTLILGDVVHVAFQERFVLEPYFGEAYREYQRTTPFLIPNRASAARFLAGLRGRRPAEP
ncbi:MAG TPA: methyltransferase [Dehalococcoidia bacterium]